MDCLPACIRGWMCAPGFSSLGDEGGVQGRIPRMGQPPARLRSKTTGQRALLPHGLPRPTLHAQATRSRAPARSPSSLSTTTLCARRWSASRCAARAARAARAGCAAPAGAVRLGTAAQRSRLDRMPASLLLLLLLLALLNAIAVAAAGSCRCCGRAEGVCLTISPCTRPPMHTRA